jgi:hypothetical protein
MNHEHDLAHRTPTSHRIIKIHNQKYYFKFSICLLWEKVMVKLLWEMTHEHFGNRQQNITLN